MQRDGHCHDPSAKIHCSTCAQTYKLHALTHTHTVKDIPCKDKETNTARARRYQYAAGHAREILTCNSVMMLLSIMCGMCAGALRVPSLSAPAEIEKCIHSFAQKHRNDRLFEHWISRAEDRPHERKQACSKTNSLTEHTVHTHSHTHKHTNTNAHTHTHRTHQILAIRGH